MKLAPIDESSGLQPLPATVHADVSQNVNGTTSDALSRTIEQQGLNSQTVQQNTRQQQPEGVPKIQLGGFAPLWIVFAAVIAIIAVAAWFWRNF